MFDPFFSGLAWLLAFFYDLFDELVGTNAYALAIIALTLAIMIVFTPLTIKGTRSMMQMSTIQPEIKRLQALHRGDRQKLNEEMMKLYQANGVNPLGGCLPTLIQIPIFFVLYRVVNGLTTMNTIDEACGGTSGFCPKYLDEKSQLYRDLIANDEMRSFGMDLARSANDVLRESFVDALPYLGLVLVTFGLAWYQQRQMKARRSAAAAPNRQMEVMMKVLPFMLPVFSFLVQSALAVYFVASSLYRIGQQAYIHRTMVAAAGTGPSLIDVETTEPKSPKPVAPRTGGLLGRRGKAIGGPTEPAEIAAPEVTNERSLKAREAEQKRLQDRAARSAARSASGSAGEIGTARVPKQRQGGQGQKGKGQNKQSRKPSGNQGKGGKSGNASKGKADQPNSVSGGVIDETGEAAATAETAATVPAEGATARKSRRGFFGLGAGGRGSARSNGKSGSNSKTPPTQPIQSRRTAGDGRRRKKR